MATKAVSAQGVSLYVQKSTGGSGWDKFEEVSATPEIGMTAATIDVTSLDSTYKEYIPDIPDFGGSALEFTMNAQPSGEANSNIDLLESLDPEETYTFKVQYPQIGKEYQFTARPAFRMGAGAVSSKQDVILTLVPSGAPTFQDDSAVSTLTYMEE